MKTSEIVRIYIVVLCCVIGTWAIAYSIREVYAAVQPIRSTR
jgi:hypothetical protein